MHYNFTVILVYLFYVLKNNAVAYIDCSNSMQSRSDRPNRIFVWKEDALAPTRQ